MLHIETKLYDLTNINTKTFEMVTLVIDLLHFDRKTMIKSQYWLFFVDNLNIY